MVSLIALLRPVEHQYPYPWLLRAYQLLAFHERKSQPVELIVVLTLGKLSEKTNVPLCLSCLSYPSTGMCTLQTFVGTENRVVPLAAIG